MTMPNASCPQCSAALPPGAPRCNYCGLVTPWGAVLQQQNERAAFLQADQDKRRRIASATDGARNGMIVALVGLPICCGPVSIVGGVMGWRAGSKLVAEGQPRPVTSVVSVVVAVIATALFITGTIMYIRDQREKEAHIAAVGQRLEGKRDVEVLDAKIACDLVEEHLAKNGFGGSALNLGEVHCDGAFSASGRRASQPDVRFAFGDKRFTANACLERRSRWFVLEVGEGLSCGDLPPPADFTPPPRKLSDAEAAADEDKARKDAKQAIAGKSVRTFVEQLAKVRVDAASAPLAETTCSKEAMKGYVTGGTRKKVLTADFDQLQSGGAPWAILASSQVTKAIDEKASIDDRAKAVAEFASESGDLLVVYKASEKHWPVVKGTKTSSKDFSFDGGEFTGQLLVYDLRLGARLCATKLAFESSESVDFRKSKYSDGKSSAKDAVEGDFKDHFESAATDAIKRAAPDLRLGYLLLE